MALLPRDLQQTMSKVMEMTKHHRKYIHKDKLYFETTKQSNLFIFSSLFMNICVAYTSREEMTKAVRDVCDGVEKDKLDIE